MSPEIVGDGPKGNPKKYTVKERVFLDADGNVVDENSPAAASLYATPGKRVPYDEAVELGLVSKPASKPAAKKKPAAKQKAPASNKKRTPAKNKGK